MRSSTNQVGSWGLLSMLLASGAAAAPLISHWNIQSDGLQEKISLRWNEAGSYDINQFPEAGQFVVVIPGATLTSSVPTTLDTGESLLLSRARLQNVTLSDGTPGVQLTIQMNQWAQIESQAGEDHLEFSMLVPKELRPLSPAPAASEQRRLELTDEKLRDLEQGSFGSWNAPETGAGQATTTSGSGSLSDFYVPADLDENIRRGPRSQSGLGEAIIDSRLNEIVDRVDFQGTSLENVLRLIAEEAELNFLINPQHVQGRTVTLRLRNVTLRHMLDVLLKSNNLGYTVEPGGIINVVPRDRIRATTRETVTETIAINWVNAEDVAVSLRPFVDTDRDGALQVVPHSNQIIIRDVPETVRQVQEMINLIDIPEKQVLMEMRLVNMSETAGRSMGVRTSFMDQEGKFITESSTATITDGEVTTSASGNIITRSSGAAGLLAPIVPGAEGLLFNQLGSVGIFGNRYDVDFSLNALETRGEAVTLANPTVLSLNNVEASVEIQRSIPYITAINTDQGSVGTVDFINVGTRVIVLPRITPNGYVQMRISPEQILDTGDRPGGVPQTDTRRVEASVIVKDEQTIALGGLRQFEASSGENGVPYLLRLPVFSWLFKNQSNSQTRTEMYLFVTPHIIKDPTPTAYQQALYDKIDYNWDLPDFYFDEMFSRDAPGEEAALRRD